MKSTLTLFLLAILFAIPAIGQIGINATNTPPDPSSMLDIKSTSKGLLIPRMTTNEKNAIVNKIEGLTVYDTDLKQFSYWTNPGSGSVWQNFGSANGSGGFALPYTATLTNANTLFNITNSSTTNTNPVISAKTASIAINATSIYGELSGNAPDDNSAAIIGDNISAGSYGSGVFGKAIYGKGIKGYSFAGTGVYGYTTSGNAIVGRTDATGGMGAGAGVSGLSLGGNGNIPGVHGESNSIAYSNNPANGAVGVSGIISSTLAGKYSAGVRGVNNAIENEPFNYPAIGVLGISNSNIGCGVTGESDAGRGVYGNTVSGYGVFGASVSGKGIFGSSSSGIAVYGVSNSATGVFGFSTDKNGIWGTTNNPSAYAIYSEGNAYKTSGGSNWNIPSDLQLKRDIKPFTDGLNVITQIHPKRYFYNGLANTKTEQEEFGIIAQDMQKIAPYTIFPRKVKLSENDMDTTEILTYNSSALTYVIINAIKELHEENKLLKERLIKLEMNNTTVNTEIGIVKNTEQ